METIETDAMEECARYLGEALGLSLSHGEWDGERLLPLFLRKAADYRLCSCAGTEFVAAVPKGEEALPALKRVVAQTRRRTDLPVALVSPDVDPRQRRALTAQGVAFVVPHRQAYLPFLALAATAEADRRSYAGALTAGGQAALVALIANQGVSSSRALREVTGMGASTASRAVDELARRGLIRRAKEGREVVFDYDRGKNALLKQAMPMLSSPVARTTFARRGAAVEPLPDAGTSALSSRSMLAAPPIACKAVAVRALRALALEEVLEGELPDEETVELQVWRYDPLVAGQGAVDDVSLAASLAGLADERVTGELDELFGEEGLWL